MFVFQLIRQELPTLIMAFWTGDVILTDSIIKGASDISVAIIISFELYPITLIRQLVLLVVGLGPRHTYEVAVLLLSPMMRHVVPLSAENLSLTFFILGVAVHLITIFVDDGMISLPFGEISVIEAEMPNADPLVVTFP
jgi:hypothetical protein